MSAIRWQRLSALDGARVVWDAYIGDRKVGQVAKEYRFNTPKPTVWWSVWANGNGGTYRKLTDAKAEVERLFAEVRS